ncbi:hypothetical protein AA637_16015 (plasmid) [Cyanobacterium sp. HL-69]|nr:hypothetical protein AA637_16015 [Cyanobacterium sp. HL-69]
MIIKNIITIDHSLFPIPHLNQKYYPELKFFILMIMNLSSYFTLQRRYGRSINLERDFNDVSALNGYVLTDKSVETLKRILLGISGDNKYNCWTLTGVYGTGKSAFVHFLISLLANSKNKLKKKALGIANSSLNDDIILSNIPDDGMVRAIAVSQREAISLTIIRALINGLKDIGGKLSKEFISQLEDLEGRIKDNKTVQNTAIVSIIKDILLQTKKDIILVIDELGKNLEYAVYNQGAEDLYLLQQLAELEAIEGKRIYILGILHQAFTEYGQRLATIQRNEWSKITGRFEDIAFTESTGQMIKLISEAISPNIDNDLEKKIDRYSCYWYQKLESIFKLEKIEQSLIKNIYPLHPLSALILPVLCVKYAQNDRTLFTFITSDEPFSFKKFLEETVIKDDNLPTLKLDQIYDYFISSVGMGLTRVVNFQRWVEIYDLINDAKHLDEDSLRLLKAIGLLNLVSITGITRATRNLVAHSLCDGDDDDKFNYWQEKIDTLLRQGLITHRKQIDELRIWKGSDYNIDAQLESYLKQEQSSLAKLLSQLRPLKPIIAQRHSYQKGTLRYFERHYLDSSVDLTNLECEDNSADGWLGYWLGEEIPSSFPQKTVNGLPVIFIAANNLQVLRLQAQEFSALNRMNNEAKELQSDGVARKEVRYRLIEAQKALDDTLNSVFDFSRGECRCWIGGNLTKIDSVRELNSYLSVLCDETFSKSPILWNELINRRNLTSQGSKARRELITGMINHFSLPKFGFSGYGPEVTMYYSLLQETGIHRPISSAENTLKPSDSKDFALHTTPPLRRYYRFSGRRVGYLCADGWG